jgi:hypothetical protein
MNPVSTWSRQTVHGGVELLMDDAVTEDYPAARPSPLLDNNRSVRDAVPAHAYAAMVAVRRRVKESGISVRLAALEH